MNVSYPDYNPNLHVPEKYLSHSIDTSLFIYLLTFFVFLPAIFLERFRAYLFFF